MKSDTKFVELLLVNDRSQVSVQCSSLFSYELMVFVSNVLF